jgi:hypothetical protein
MGLIVKLANYLSLAAAGNANYSAIIDRLQPKVRACG